VKGFLKVDPRLPSDPNLTSIAPRLRMEALGSWLALGLYCASYDHTGFVSVESARRYARRPILEALLEAGLITESPDGRGYYLAHGRRDAYDLWQIERCEHRRKIPADARERVFLRDGNACVRCGAAEDLTLDHIYPWSLGGSDHVSNLQTLCRSCNASKGARL
jgi:HNH endonuclease